ncbi:MAG: hypothetical protein OEY01_03785 [Desulfobulbaceae bacterium]|nr:hypothetical protein [Desulfobulbaceae bacterium]
MRKKIQFFQIEILFEPKEVRARAGKKGTGKILRPCTFEDNLGLNFAVQKTKKYMSLQYPEAKETYEDENGVLWVRGPEDWMKLPD